MMSCSSSFIGIADCPSNLPFLGFKMFWFAFGGRLGAMEGLGGVFAGTKFGSI
jgi:hypothetical protein